MRAFFLIVVAVLILALGGLEVLASRHAALTDPLPDPSVSTPWR